MSEEQQFCLRWNNFQANITSQFEALRDEEDFVDVTLACDGQRLKAHKVVLSACSPYFKELFKSNPCKHPILFLRDVAFHHLRALVEFMYAGEVNVAQAQLSAFLRTAESLQIRGLTEAPQKHKQAHIRQQQQQQPNLPSEVTASVGLDSSSAADEVASSPECVGIDEDEDAISLSPGDGSSPNPAKRQCLQQDGGDATHQRTQTSTSSSHSDLRQELEAVTKDSPGDIVEPKMELPDYASDGESKAGAAAFLGLDSNSVDVNASFAAALHGGGMDILPGPSAQSFLGEPSGSLDSGQVDHRKLHSLDPRPCPICNRMYSNLSNLRQHVRLIHNPQTVACPICSKPFKTKLYLKRHLMSFHEIFCGNMGPGGVQGGPKQGGEFYPPPPQVFLGPSSMGEEEERKRNSEGISKVKEQQNLEIFQVSQASMLHTSLPHSGHDEQSRTHNTGKMKDPPSHAEVFHHRSFHSALHHVTGHEDKSNIHNTNKGKQSNANMDLFQMPRIFHSIITSPSFQTNSEDKSNFMRSSSSLQHSKTKESHPAVQSFHTDEERGDFLLKSKDIQQRHTAELFQSPGSFPSASQAQTAGEEKVSNFHTSSSVLTKNKAVTHSDLYHTGQSFSTSSDGRDIYSTSADKELPGLGYVSQNHKDNQSFVSSSQTQTHNKIVNSDDFNSTKNEDNLSACTNFVGGLSVTSSDNTGLALLTQSLPASGDEGLSFLNQKSSGSHDTSAFLNESYSHTKRGLPESSMENESLNHEPDN